MIYVLFTIIYFLGWILSYKYMFKYFKRDILSDKAFKYHVLFISSIWFIYFPIMFCILYVALYLIVLPVLYITYLILFPVQTTRETIQYFKKFIR